MNESHSGRIKIAWLAIVGGGLLAALSLLYESRGKPLPAGVVATVGNHAILRAQWQRAVQSVENDRGRALDRDERRAVLDRLIDEELLFQHALGSGLVRDDPGLRKTVIAALIDATTAGGAVDERAAQALFARDPGYFAAQPRLQVAALRCTADDLDVDAGALRQALLGDAALPPACARVVLPDEPLPLAQLAQRLGGSAAAALHRAETGALIGPIAQRDAVMYALLRSRYADSVRYEDVAEAVRSEWQRRNAEAALAALLAGLRDGAAIRYADDAR
ncbi:hypothetical protein [Sinimarinibacterium thermocellulolyticum]|uniref:Uncharacterized protein n=1 Tax=Sinimarinibacterium thermocellulolyticum TaxID=3170016 RepID=A0ABV2A8G4_9GAMM